MRNIMLLIALLILAILVGKVVSKMKMPAILGWLLTGMIIGPHALNWLNTGIMDSQWYHVICSISEITAGLFIGTELIWKELRKSGKQILTICCTEALGAFISVSLAFGIIFALTDIPVYLGFIFGAIALATAPAPSLSIISEYKAKGPVTNTLIPLAILDDVIALIVFFTIMGIVSNALAGGGMPLYYAPLMILLSIVVGIITGLLASVLLKIKMKKTMNLFSLIFFICLTTMLSRYINYNILSSPMMNLMLVGVSFAATFSNIISEERLLEIKSDSNVFIGLAMVVLILNLGAPLDYHLIIGAGLYTAIYILSRAFGKISGTYIGARLSNAPDAVRKYLGLTLLPHSGVSLIFTGIAVSTIGQYSIEYASIIQGTIAAAAVINEIFAVVLAKQGFRLAGELDK